MNILDTWKNWSKKLKLQTYTLYYAYKDPMTPWYAKVLSAAVVAYAFSPIDLIPDFVPMLGYLDDLILIPLGIALAVKLIPKEIMIRCRQQAKERIDSKRPVNWIAGGIIIAIWIMVFCAVVYIILRRILK
jgi:uncharacterized membrane protein YkvA (DUF1232 family)